MAAYATHERELSARQGQFLQDEGKRQRYPRRRGEQAWREPRHEARTDEHALELSLVEQLIDRLADRLAGLLAERLGSDTHQDVEWFDSRRAAEYLGVHRDTLRKLAAERTIPSEQEGAGCKLYFRRVDLDAWRRSGGRPRHLASVPNSAA